MRISGLSSDGCTSEWRAGEAYRRTPRGRGARRQRPLAIRASWRPQGRGASFRSDLQALDAARGGHVAAVLAGEARDGHVLAALAVSGCHLVAGRSGHLAAVLAGDDQVPARLEAAVAAGALQLAVDAVRAGRAAVHAGGIGIGDR